MQSLCRKETVVSPSPHFCPLRHSLAKEKRFLLAERPAEECGDPAMIHNPAPPTPVLLCTLNKALGKHSGLNLQVLKMG